MREIKFRAWDTKEKRMIEQGLFIECNGLVFHDEGDMGYLLKEIAKKDRYILLQFIGLKDKNGKEIYEGDILSCEPYLWSKMKEYIIVEIKKGFGVNFEWYYNYKWEVIGNKFENPKLLK